MQLDIITLSGYLCKYQQRKQVITNESMTTFFFYWNDAGKYFASKET